MSTNSAERSRPLPSYELRQTEKRGRGLFATHKILKGSLIFQSDDPLVSVICNAHRKQTCALCFRYQSRRNLSLRLPSGLRFCSLQCHNDFLRKHSNHLPILARFDRLLHKIRHASAKDSMCPPLTEAQQDAAWLELELERSRSDCIQPLIDIDIDEARFFLAGCLLRLDAPALYTQRVLPLARSEIAYVSNAVVQADLATARIIRALLPDVVASTVRELRERDTGNSFGIREDDELLGYGLYALPASALNHACSANVQKERVGARWQFNSLRDIEIGEELCISYIGDSDSLENMSRTERQNRLNDGWNFICACGRCT